MPKPLRLAIAGVGNCASSLVQGLFYYKAVDTNNELVPGLMHNVLGGYRISDVKPVAAFDVDKRKVGRDLSEAIFAKPNCTKTFCKDVPKLGVTVQKGPVLDGVANHMKDYPEDRTFVVSDDKPVNVAKVLKESGAEVLINYMPVGSEQATQYYAQAALDANMAFVNCMPAFIASVPSWAEKFRAAGLPIVGDDIKSQVGATITHRVLTKLFADRGVKID
ncbi:MAG TPA: inositol-3-phosphate synthase, partial [archaeon]|nr:inositol-3-phosphate synthase [archaeon]